MKYWKYQLLNRANAGTEENPKWVESFVEKMVPATEANEAIAKAEAYNGEYTIEDDGQPEIEKEITTYEIIDVLLGVVK